MRSMVVRFTNLTLLNNDCFIFISDFTDLCMMSLKRVEEEKSREKAEKMTIKFITEF